MTAERDFPEIARAMLAAVVEAAGAREGALFIFSDRPACLSATVSQGFALLPDPAVVPLLPRHVHALTTARQPVLLNTSSYDIFLSANGNVAPELFKCLAPLRAAGRLAGAIMLGRREGEALYEEDDLGAIGLICNYVALAVQNHNLTQTLTQRVAENLKLMASMHGFYDNTLEAFAAAIDVKHVNIQGHSLRVGRYAAAIGEALALEPTQITALRSAGYLHDIGKVAVDKALFGKPAALDAREFQEMADHTTVGHEIVSQVQFPWPMVPEIVRWHHERGDGSGYPDHLHAEELPLPVRIIALADTFDAMTTERPYRDAISLGGALSELVRLSPQKFDADVLQALLVQVRRDAVGSNRTPFLPGELARHIAPPDVDQLAALLQHKVTQNRLYLT
jgi:putative nucleotidyltransferase with HDIG domain